MQLLWIGLLVPALILGTRHAGIRGAGMAHAIVAIVFVIPAYVLALSQVGIRPSSLGRAMGRVMLGAVAGTAVILPLRSLPIGELGQLAVAGLAGSIVFLAVAIGSEDKRSVLEWWRRRRAGRALATA